MRFTKAHGLGNDFVILDGFEEPTVVGAPLGDLARAMCDRRRGVGADQVLTIEPAMTPDADVRMRVFNADGGEAEMCGNGVRCVARLASERGRTRSPRRLVVQTRSGPRGCEILADGAVRVGMGLPEFDPAAVGFDERAAHVVDRRGAMRIAVVEGIRGGLVRVGTPNFVVFNDTPVSIAYVSMHGAMLETHRAFPNRMNVQFATRVAPDRVIVRTWERGAGLTEACGTGACAVFAVGRAKGLLDRAATIALPGGELRIDEDERGQLHKTGPATIVFDGRWPA